MAHRRPLSPFWDGATNGAVTSRSDDKSSEFTRAVKGLVRRVVDPNRPDPSNPVINGASGGQRSWLRNLIADIATQVPRIGANVDLLSSIADTKIFDGSIVNDRDYQVRQSMRLL